MARRRAIEAAVEVLEKEGTSVAFGVPGAAINPLHAALRERGSIRHILARHVEGASHMARARAGQRYGVDHVTVAEGPGSKAMGTELHSVNELEEILCLDPSLTLDDVSGTVLETGATRIDRAPGGTAPTPADGVEARP